jgi:hypothetical protein
MCLQKPGTRLKGLVAVKVVQVQVLSPALQGKKFSICIRKPAEQSFFATISRSL